MGKFLLMLVGLMAGGCAMQGQTPAVAEEAPTIVTIVSRERVVEVKASGHGALYTARDKQGRVVFENLTRAQVKGADPKLFEQMEQQYVADKRGPRADVTMVRWGAE